MDTRVAPGRTSYYFPLKNGSTVVSGSRRLSCRSRFGSRDVLGFARDWLGEERHPLEVVGEGDAADPGLGAVQGSQACAAESFAFQL